MVRQVYTHVSCISRLVGTGSRVVTCMVLLMASEAAASDNDERERTLLFNTRGLAVSGAVATGIFFAAAAKLKLAFLESTIEEKKVKSGVLLELICSRAQSKLLINWFRARRMTLRILPGESRDREGAVRNGVAVFYDNDTYRALAGDSVEKYSRCVSDPTASEATRLGERILVGCRSKTHIRGDGAERGCGVARRSPHGH